MWVFLCVIYSVPVVCLPILMPIPCHFCYYCSVVQFKVWHCDTSCFTFSIQDCFGYSRSLVLPDEVHGCFFYFYQECHWDFNWNCIESVQHFRYYGHFENINSVYPRTWEIFPSSKVFFNFFLQCSVVLIVQVFHLFCEIETQVFYFFRCYCEWSSFPNFFF